MKHSSVLLPVSAICFLMSGANAQESDLEEIVVTGSHIGNAESSTSPVLTIDSAALTEVPRSNLSDYFFTDVTANVARESALEEGTEQGRLDGARNAAINLRGLGKENTLVLIDGQRTVEYAVVDGNGWGAVDINTAIPRIALSRIEVLLDGGSALYGTDAVAGVVNLIPNYEFDGFKLQASTNRFGSAMGKANDTISMLAGANGETTNMFVALEYSTRDRVTQSDTGDKDYQEALDGGIGGALSFTNGTGRRSAAFREPLCGNAADLGVDPVFAGGASGPGGCGYYDWASLARQQETESINMMIGFEHEFTDQLKGTFGAIVGSQDITTYPQWGSIFSFDSNGDALAPNAQVVGIPYAHPAVQYYVNQYPESQWATMPTDAILYSSAMPMMNYLGEVATDHEVDTNRINGKLNFELNETWDLTGYMTYGESKVVAHRHQAIPANVEAALNGLGGPNCDTGAGAPGENGCEYFNPFMSSALAGASFDGVPLRNSNELINWMYPQDTRDHRRELLTMQLMAAGDLPLELSGGAVGVAIGLERREDDLTVDFDPILNNGGYGAFKGVLTPDYSGKEEVNAAFFEFGVPVLENLNVQLAGRYEDYKFASMDTFNGKVGFNWAATEQLIVRGSFGNSFKAPTIFQTQATSYIDPGWGSIGDPTDADYVGGFGGGTSRALLNEIIAPNPTLNPQESDNWSIGFDWHITDRFSIGADYVSIEFDNIIYIPSPTNLLRLSSCNMGTTSTPVTDATDGIHPHFIPVAGFPCFELDQSAIPDGSNYAAEVEVGRPGAAFRDAYFQGVYISPQNLAFRNIDAVDLDVSWGTETPIGDLNIRAQATILLKFDEKTDPNGATQDFVGKANTFGGGYSEYRVNVPIRLSTNSHSFSLTPRYISSMDPIVPGSAQATYGSHTQVDFNWIWNIGDRYRTSLFVNNLFDEVPENLAPAQFPRDGRRVGLQFELTLGGM